MVNGSKFEMQFVRFVGPLKNGSKKVSRKEAKEAKKEKKENKWLQLCYLRAMHRLR